MILSNRAIQAALDEGRLILRPEPQPRTPTADTPNTPYDTTSVDLHLARTISVPRPELGPFAFDLSCGDPIAPFLAQTFEDIDLTVVGSHTLDPGKFILAQTMEYVELPLLPDKAALAARIEGKSSCARCGILVHFTAPTVHAGWAGKLTLEMANLGPRGFVLRPGQAICQLILEIVEGVPFENRSQFYGQTTPPGTKQQGRRSLTS